MIVIYDHGSDEPSLHSRGTVAAGSHGVGGGGEECTCCDKEQLLSAAVGWRVSVRMNSELIWSLSQSYTSLFICLHLSFFLCFFLSSFFFLCPLFLSSSSCPFFLIINSLEILNRINVDTINIQVHNNQKSLISAFIQTLVCNICYSFYFYLCDFLCLMQSK